MTIILSADKETGALSNYWVISETLFVWFQPVYRLYFIGNSEVKKKLFKRFGFCHKFNYSKIDWECFSFLNNKYSVFSEAFESILA